MHVRNAGSIVCAFGCSLHGAFDLTMHDIFHAPFAKVEKPGSPNGFLRSSPCIAVDSRFHSEAVLTYPFAYVELMYTMGTG